MDPEIAEFERGLLESIGQVKRGEVGRMLTPGMIAGYIQGVRQRLAGADERCAEGMAADAFAGLMNERRWCTPVAWLGTANLWELGGLAQCSSFKHAPIDFLELVEGTVVPQIHQKWLKRTALRLGPHSPCS